MWAEEHSPFRLIPVELKWKIFEYLNIPDKKKSRFVCAHWLAIIDEKLKSRTVLTDETQFWIFSGCRSHLKSLTIQNLTKFVPKSCLQNTLLKIDECVIGRGNSGTNILNLLSFYSNHIDRLQIQNLSLATIKSGSLSDVLQNAEWSNLSTLSLTMGSSVTGVHNNETSCKMHADASTQLLKSLKLTTLKSLTINFSKGPYFVKPWEEIFDFILKQKEFLRELKLVLIGKPQPPPVKNYKQLTQFSELKLKKFIVRFDAYHIPYVNDLCSSMGGLIHLGIYLEHSTFGDMSALNLPKILDVHMKNTLKTLRSQCRLFDLSLLMGFNSLEILEIETHELTTVQAMPSLHRLRKFSVAVHPRHLGIPKDIFIESMINQMPNLEEVELLGWSISYSDHHLRTIMNLPQIRVITLGEIGWSDDFFRRIRCHEHPRFPRLTEKMRCAKFSDAYLYRVTPFSSFNPEFNRRFTIM